MRILITGGAGYIGSVLATSLRNSGHEITVLDNFAYRQQSLNHLCGLRDFIVVAGDVRDKSLMRKLLGRADVFVPLAAIVGAPACEADPNGATSINLEAIEATLRMMSDEQRIIIPTTNSGYGIGQAGGKECDEDTPLQPISLYGQTKVAAERAVLERGNAISLRLATVFGMSPRMRLDLLVNDFVHRAITDRFVVLFEAHFRRNYIHVRDVARAFDHAIENFEEMKDKPYNVGLSDANLTKAELCQAIKEIIPDFTVLEAAVGEDPDKRDYLVSNARIEATGYKPLFSLEDGIRELAMGLRMLRPAHTNL